MFGKERCVTKLKTAARDYKTPSFDRFFVTLRRNRLSWNGSYNNEIEMMLCNFDGATHKVN